MSLVYCDLTSFISVLQYDTNVGNDVGWGFTLFSLSNL
jgi:hypothetical protein